MITGTPLDITPFGALLHGIGLLYWFFVIGALALVLIKVKGKLAKLLSAIATFGILVGPVAVPLVKMRNEKQAFSANQSVAMKRFEELCKGAGEKIFRTVDNVDGVLLMKVRSQTSLSGNDPMWPSAALASEVTGDDYIRSFLLYEWRADGAEDRRGNVNSGPTSRPGYQFVDVEDFETKKRYRYTMQYEDLKNQREIGIRRSMLKREETTATRPQYGITYEDIVHPDDRKLWIAGTVIKVLDLNKNDVVAEEIGYLMDTGQGSTIGFRDSWGWAASYGLRCPKSLGGGTHTRFFVDQILKPTQKK